MDEITIKRIQKVHPKLRDELLADYIHVNNKLLGKGERLRFPYTTRTRKEQEDLYAQGRTKPGKKVTNALWYQTYHLENYALAFDIVLLYDLDGNGTFETASWDMKKDHDKDGKSDWMTVVNYFKSKGWKWGGDFTKLPDSPHFEKTFGYHWKDLKEKLDKKDFIKGTTYVNI